MIGSIVMIVAGVAVTVVGVLGRIGKLPRNRLAGLRLPSTMRSDQAFAAGNRAAGPATAAGGLAALISGTIALSQPAPKAQGWILLGALTLATLAIIGAIQGSRAATKADDQ